MILPEGLHFDRLTDPRLREHVRVTDSGCWEWTRSRTEAGYGRISWRGRVERVHRVAAALVLGFDLCGDGVVCHRCDNPPCFNPDHLFIGTLSDNTQDMIAKGRGYAGPQPQTHCAKGHAIEGENAVSIAGQLRCRTCRNGWLRGYHRRRLESDPGYRDRSHMRASGVEGLPHGEALTYKNGCRCDECKAANAAHSRLVRARRRDIRDLADALGLGEHHDH